MKSSDVRAKYIAYFVKRGHKEIPSASLVPENDPTTLFTSSGMQPLIPYLLGQPHPLGKRLVDSQKSFRSQDIDEVGDNRHTTFFEMLGNWSLGDYFKKEQLPWIFELLTKELGLDKERLYVSVFEGNASVLKDTGSIGIWKEIFAGVGMDAKEGKRIFAYPAKNNWWSRSGEPEKMPPGEPGGPDSEVFFDFGEELELHEKSQYKNEKCHPNCGCGRFLEISNSVFMQYQKMKDGKIAELSQKNVDFGGGLERMTAATDDNPDIFTTDMFLPVIEILSEVSGKTYGEHTDETRAMRIIADHMRAAIMMMTDGVLPSNKTQGYMLRRLIRRSLLYGRRLGLTHDLTYIGRLVEPISIVYEHAYPQVVEKAAETKLLLQEEAMRFSKTLESGIREIERDTNIFEVFNPLRIPEVVKLEIEAIEELGKTLKWNIKNPFFHNLTLLFTKSGVIDTFIVEEQRQKINELIEIGKRSGLPTSFLLENQLNRKESISPQDYKRFKEILEYFRNHRIKLNAIWTFRFVSTYGVPLELLEEIVRQKGLELDTSELDKLESEHQDKSRTSAKGMFKGGLADKSEEVTRLHTAHHLLLAALQKIVDPTIKQRGSNITAERLRMDFNFARKLTPEEIKKVEELVNNKIAEDLPVVRVVMELEKAEKVGAQMEFGQKYPERVSVYFVGDQKNFYSAEFCGGPHVTHTGEIGSFKILKEESSGSGIRRIYATVKKPA